jgi:hypothetical protein
LKILAIDLGDNTGWVYVELTNDTLEPRLRGHGTVLLADLEARLTAESVSPDLVVIERPAYTPNRMQQQYSDLLTSLILRFAEKTAVIRATEWKQRFGRHPLPGRGVLRTQHERDAWRIAAWAADKYARETVNTRRKY